MTLGQKGGWGFEVIDFDVQNKTSFGKVRITKDYPEYNTISNDFRYFDPTTSYYHTLLGPGTGVMNLITINMTTGDIEKRKETKHNFVIAASNSPNASYVTAAAYDTSTKCPNINLGILNITSADFNSSGCLGLAESGWIHDISSDGRWAAASSPPVYSKFELAATDSNGTVLFHETSELEKGLKALLKADKVAIGSVIWAN